MKLYTEEQVIDAINKSFVIEYPSTGNDILNELIPIILPSDEEIQKENPHVFGSHVFGTRDLLIWEQGAQWMRDKIDGGNK